MIKDGIIKATDLRLRFEFGGDIGSVVFISTDPETRSVRGKSGNMNFKIELPYVKIDNLKGYLSTSGDEKTKWVDFVFYSGPEQAFNFEKIEEAVIGFLLSVKAGKTLDDYPVKAIKSDKYLQFSWKGLQIKALAKPYSEQATLILK